MRLMPTELLLCRHGETAWALSGQHTGRTDIPLTPQGRIQAKRLQSVLEDEHFDAVFVSPLLRARETAELAGFSPVVAPELIEWDYGDYEGLTHAQIMAQDPSWDLFVTGTPHGETAAEVAARADAFLKRCQGRTLVFSHGHFLRMLAARWLGLPPTGGKLFSLSVARLSILGFERNTPVIKLWNASQLQNSRPQQNR